MKLLRCISGISAVEFGIMLPFVIMLTVGMVEIGRLELIHLKLDKVAHSMADFTTQESVTPSKTSLENFISSAPHFMKPFGFNGTIIFSSIITDITPENGCSSVKPCFNLIKWQYRGNSGVEESAIGIVGQKNVSLPGNYVIPSGNNIIVAEVFYRYNPLIPISGSLFSTFSAHNIYKIAMYKPRQGTFTVSPN